MDLTAVLAWLTLLVAFPLNAFAAVLLYREYRSMPSLRVLRERFIVACAMTFLVLFFGLIFVNNDRTIPPVSLEATKYITRAAILAAGLITALGWLLLFNTIGKRRTKVE